MTQLGWKPGPYFRRYRVPFQITVYGLCVGVLLYAKISLVESLLYGALASIALQLLVYAAVSFTGGGHFMVTLAAFLDNLSRS